MSIDEETLLAFIDGELDPGRRAEVEAALASDPALAERARLHRALARRLDQAYAPVAEEPIPDRLLQAVGRGGGEVVDVPAAPRLRRPVLPRWAALAASLAVGMAAGAALVGRVPQPLIGQGPSGLQAHGALARALDQELASAPEGPIRIGLSFLSADGRYCRTFQAPEGGGLAGLACKQGRVWRVRVAAATAAPGQTGAYQTAATETPAPVLDAAQALMAGQPLDARQEAAARARGWRR